MKTILPVLCLALLVFSVAAVSASDDVGKTVYTKSCAACHDSGVMGAPGVPVMLPSRSIRPELHM